MLTTNVPKQFCGDSILTTYYLTNNMSTRVFNYQTPLKTFLQLYAQTQSINQLSLKVFGCRAFVHVLDQNQTKLDPTALAYIFLGYSATQKGYRHCSPKKQKYCHLDVTFFLEPTFFSKTSLQGQNIDKENFWELSLLSLLPEQPPNLLPNPTISPKQLLN